MAQNDTGATTVAAPAPSTDNNDLVVVRNLKKYFPIRRGVFQRVVGQVQAVDGVSFAVQRGETLGLVGESGCGKSTAGKAILQLDRPTSGEVWLDGEDLVKLKGEKLRLMRRKMQIIFQDPF
ncbi:MAG: ATP-binding cassette domain-containing protein, partial [Chloroflexi bacterium]|nr:ATP-binding cassette domain-containing protein [Chloroflexota bacterium]